MEELVSIIMPSYNTGAYIADTIRSVQQQTYRNWELIIVDDCSDDDTAAVVQPFLSDERIHFFHNAVNSGAALSRNQAIRMAQGRWIAFLDSDDLWEKDKLCRQVFFMEKNNYYFSYTEYKEIDSEGNDMGRIISGPRRITKTGFYNYCWPGCLTVMYDVKKIGQIQIADIRKNNDYAMWLKICQKADCFLLDECLARYRKGRAGSVSSHSFMSMIGWHYRLFREAEGKSATEALLCTGRNMLFGTYKKLRYIKRV